VFTCHHFLEGVVAVVCGLLCPTKDPVDSGASQARGRLSPGDQRVGGARKGESEGSHSKEDGRCSFHQNVCCEEKEGEGKQGWEVFGKVHKNMKEKKQNMFSLTATREDQPSEGGCQDVKGAREDIFMARQEPDVPFLNICVVEGFIRRKIQNHFQRKETSNKVISHSESAGHSLHATL